VTFVRAKRRRLVSALAAAGLLGVVGLPLSGGQAQAESTMSAQAQLTPGPGEWWFAGWQVQQRVWPLTEGAGVTVAVLDSGVQASLPDLAGVVLPGGDMTGAGGDGDTDGNDGNDGHGTEVAALIGGQGFDNSVLGIAPRAMILPVRIGNSGTDSLLVVAEAIRFAVRHGAQVINMSFGSAVASPTGCDPVLSAAIGYALERNVVVVAASGDAALIHGPVEPASCPGVLAIGGVEPDGSLWRGSTREPYVAVVAPGDHIAFTGRDGLYSTTAWGTSFSAALVAGAAALIRSRYPHMPWYEVDQRLIDTAIPVSRPVPNDGYGYGIVDLARAVNASAYPVRSSAPNPVYTSFMAWLATPQGRAASAAAPSPGRKSAPGAHSSPYRGKPPGMTLEESLITGVATVCAFLAVLVLALRMSRRRRGQRGPRGRDWRQAAVAAPPYARMPGHWEETSWSFGPEEDEEHGGAPGYGRPPGYGPPPLWADSPYDAAPGRDDGPLWADSRYDAAPGRDDGPLWADSRYDAAPGRDDGPLWADSPYDAAPGRDDGPLWTDSPYGPPPGRDDGPFSLAERRWWLK
jgi:type VII secretion-associated serine protease mycosin